MRVKQVRWADWASNPDHGSVACRECGAVVKGVDFFETETMDDKGRRFLCGKCAAGDEVVDDFGPAQARAVDSRPMSEMLTSHKNTVRGLILAAMNAHERKFHAVDEEPESDKPGGS